MPVSEGPDQFRPSHENAACNANNPTESPFTEGDQILCNCCGSEYLVRQTDEGKMKLEEL